MKVTVKRVGLAVLLAVFLVSAGMMVRQQLQYQDIAADSSEAARIAGLDRQETRPWQSVSPSEPGKSEASQQELLPEEAAPLASIDLEALRAVNEDVVGWIVIPGTELSYPLVQGENNQYYLSHNWKRMPSVGGAVFLEATNDREMSGFHAIIYAHEMRNDSMFGVLKYYRDLDFWREHSSIYLAIGNNICCYDIFSAQKVGIKEIIYRLDLEESHLEEEFLQYCIDNSVIDTGVVPKAGGQILTLSTCAGADRVNRWVVHAVLQTVWTVG